MKGSLAVLVFAALMGSLAGCSRAPTVVPIDSLSFPVILITGTHASKALPARADVIANREELGRMGIPTYSMLSDTTLTDPPIVIDATATAFEPPRDCRRP